MKSFNPICVCVSLGMMLLSCHAFALQSMHPPILFEPNIGLEDASVKFIARGSGYKTLLASNEVRIDYKNEDGTYAILKLNLEGSIASPVLKQDGPSKSTTHYFIGSDPSKWKIDVPAYRSATYKNVHSGIDWRFYEQEGLLEFDFIVSAGSDPSQIAMNLDGVDKISIQPSGDLLLQMKSNEFRMLAPVVYQCDAYTIDACEGRTEVKAKYEVNADRKIQFVMESYDSTKSLIIDPKIVFGTMLGGNTYDSANDVAVDLKGNFYVVGYTEANTRIPGNGDGFIHKFSPTGALVWSTFLVGSSGETAVSIAVNPAGICFVGGSTSSRDFPIGGAFQPNFGGSLDGFIVKLAANGTIMRSSFIGGSGRDTVNEVELGTGAKLGRGLYLLGNTDSRNFPRKNATQNQYAGGSQDAFLTIVHALNFQQLLSTYVGTNDRDDALSLAINPVRGDLYSTMSNSEGSDLVHFKPLSNAPAPITNYSVSKISYQSAVFNEAGSKAQSAALFGLWFFNFLLYITDPDGIAPADTNASPGLILIHSSCFSAPCNGSGTIQILDQDLNVRKTVNFGASGVGLFVNDAAVRKDGTLYIVGDTTSNNLPQTNSFQAKRKGGWEGFVMRFAPPDLTVTLSSYIGGPAHDFAGDVAVDTAGNIFVSGQTSSKNFPTTPGAPKRSMTGTADGFVTKISP